MTDTRDRSLFVTADDLDTKDWLGDEREAIERGLIASLDTARLLRAHADLGFVVAPVAARDGRPILRIRDRYAISLYPYVDGRSHAFRLQTDPARRDHLLYLLIALHSVGPPTGTPHHPPAPHRRARRARGLSGGTGRAVGRGSVR